MHRLATVHARDNQPTTNRPTTSKVRRLETNQQKHTFSSTAGARPTIPTILGMVIEEIRAIFAPNFSWTDQYFRC